MNQPGGTEGLNSCVCVICMGLLWPAWGVWSVACVRPLAAMSRFIGFNKAERANNCHLSCEAKPPHVLQIGEWTHRHRQQGSLWPYGVYYVPVCQAAIFLPPWCLAVAFVKALPGTRRSDTLLNPTRAPPKDTRLPVTVSHHWASTSGSHNAFN